MKIDFTDVSLRDLAAVISEKLRAAGFDAILVGGACVSIYTDNKYQSFDLDFVTHATIKKVAPILEDLGFKRESSRHFMRKDCPFFVEFVAPPVAIGNEPIRRETKLKTRLGTITMLTATDCVRDRLAAYYHWNDPQALEQALMVAAVKRIGMKEVERWSEQEGHVVKYGAFLRRLRKLH